MSCDGDLCCRELARLVTDYIEDAMAPDERRRFEGHLVGCKACWRYLDQLRETIRVTGALSCEQIPQEARAVLLRVFRDWKRPASLDAG